ncbi:hypothetical protein JT358_05365 [Micrococcales bacterium 31B]|nr:hypothetical protein [Micrococcales bacterium 31B]
MPKAAALSLATIELDPLRLVPPTGVVNLAEYSRFKYGDTAVAGHYGRYLADAIAPSLPASARVLVTASGYHAAPPAAAFLVPPLCRRLGELLPHAHVESFKVERSNVTNGDYATLSQAERYRALPKEALRVPADFDPTDALVVAVDDVRVSGVHESVMDAVLREAGAPHVLHGYVIDAFAAREHPELEAELNSAAVRSLDALIAVTRAPHFEPNSRLCKRVLQLSESEMHRFVRGVAPDLAAWVAAMAERDHLATVPAYREGAARYASLVPLGA